MAIVKMNKFTLLAFESEKEKLLEKLQGTSEVEFINLQNEDILETNEVFVSLNKSDVDSETFIIEENVSKTKAAIAFLKDYVADAGGLKALRTGKESLTLDELENTVMNSDWESIYSKVKGMESELAGLDNEKTRIESEIETLKPWEKFDASLGELKTLKMTSVFLGSLSKQYKNVIKSDFEKLFKESYLKIISEDNQDIYVFIIGMKEDSEKMDEHLKTYGYSPLQTKHSDIPADLIKSFRGDLKNIELNKQSIKQELKTLIDEKKKLNLAYEYYQNKLIRKRASKNFLNTEKVAVIQGWAPVKENQTIEAVAKQVSGETYYLSFEEVKEKEINSVPIKIENKGPAAAFGSITEMYSLPKYDEIDPTPILTPFYMIFFGMMVGDFGYGVILFIGCILALKLFNLDNQKKAFVKFFMWLSVATAIAGLIFGTAFGFDLDKALGIGFINPGRDTNSLLMISVLFGIIQILVGLGTKAYMLIRNKEYLFAFYDVGSWLMLLSGLGMLIGDGMIRTIGIVLAIAGSLLIVLTQGRNEATKGAKLGQGAYALYGVTSYVGDLVSYTRLMALGVAGGSIAAALNLIIGMIPRGIGFIIAAPIIFILAHIFNMALSLLGAYVHTARLQYVEFFSKFYDGGGKVFTPFKTVDNFISLKKKI